MSLVLRTKRKKDWSGLSRAVEAPAHLLAHVRTIETFMDRYKEREAPYHRVRPPNEHSNDPRTYGKLHFLSSTLLQVLAKCEPGTLERFSWRLGTCVPRELLGRSGILARTQKRLQTIYLETAGLAGHLYEQISLSAFKNLRSLSWRKVSTTDMSQLCLALQQNSSHLVHLELRESVGEIQQVATKLAGLENITFPALKDLSLGMRFPTEQVQKLSSVFAFHKLRSLKLHLCKGWQELLLSISNQDIGLKSFIIRLDRPSDMIRKAYREHSATTILAHSAKSLHALSVFIAAFSCLEELQVRCSFRLGNSLPLWRSAFGHRETLRRFVFTEEDHFVTRDEIEACGLMASPPEDLLSELAVEFLEVCCPDFGSLKRLLSQGRIRNHIRILHLRVNRSVQDKESDATSVSPDDRYPNPWSSLRLFMDWALGSDGPPLLEGIGYQDERYKFYDSLVLFRKRKQSIFSEAGYYPVLENARSTWEFLDKERDAAGSDARQGWNQVRGTA
ncbi:uncharacterized protein DSM5745_03734 [Aspergillus mulundensis]|uniref:F-box domain-containing protein n=1 Tax=Aspergillus mulundensis TaxID=1810919 RepID=A0A3D8SLF5_9EURO|nr:hypothetical protein DSM5745_03734 [Aspergillus mulundensis]RDW87092.1 hypothetical protein DSM5745_03734 [Aspergillus mulundensis]